LQIGWTWVMLGIMQSDVPILLAQVLAISLFGVLAPGPMTAATIAAGTRRRHAGALLAIGHGVVEFPLMIAITGGVGAILGPAGFRLAPAWPGESPWRCWGR
jgi:threonine/homoserine/homoserine lactone efflux protein